VLLAQFSPDYDRQPLYPAPSYTTVAVEVGGDTVEVPDPVSPGACGRWCFPRASA
jgi:hypothetical protein